LPVRTVGFNCHCQKNCFIRQKFFLHLTGGQAEIFYFRECEESLFSLTDLYKCMKNEAWIFTGIGCIYRSFWIFAHCRQVLFFYMGPT
jgi:hypothetical protein